MITLKNTITRLTTKILLTALFLVTVSQGFTQNVGINVPTPSYTLDVTTSTANDRAINLLHTAATGTNYGIYSSLTGAATTNIGSYFTATGATNNYAIIVPSGGGNVGIGTSTPTSTNALQVETSTNSGTGVRVTASGNTSTGVLSVLNGASIGTTCYGFHTQMTANSVFGNTGYYATITSSHALATNTGIATSVTAVANVNVGGSFSASGATSNYALIVPANSGNVGFGTSTPGELLEILDPDALGETAGNETDILVLKNTFSSGGARFFRIGSVRRDVSGPYGLAWYYGGNRIESNVGDVAATATWIDMFSKNSVGSNAISFGESSTTEWARFQDGGLFIGTTTDNTEALVELVSTDRAFIIMRMTAAQAAAITAENGMMLYVTSTDATFTSVGFWGYENGAWTKL